MVAQVLYIIVYYLLHSSKSNQNVCFDAEVVYGLCCQYCQCVSTAVSNEREPGP